MIDNTNCILNLVSHLNGILDGLLKVQINNVVAIVGNGNLVTVVDVGGRGSHAKDGLASRAGWEGGDGAQGVLVAEGSDFDGDGETRSEAVA